MTGPTCPACGVAVMPGYARCPKCRAKLPFGSGSKPVTAGGTAVEERRFPIVPVVAVGALAIGLALYVVMRKDDKPAATSRTAVAQNAAATPAEAARVDTAPIAVTPSPNAAAADLERILRKQRLWSTVEITGDRIDVRSSLCEDPGMGPTVDGAKDTLRGVGLTKLRCLEQSGHVVFERPL